jgi:hypothetical protein
MKTYSQNLIKRRAENRKAKIKGEKGPNHGSLIEGSKSRKFQARIGRRLEKRNARRNAKEKKK